MRNGEEASPGTRESNGRRRAEGEKKKKRKKKRDIFLVLHISPYSHRAVRVPHRVPGTGTGIRLLILVGCGVSLRVTTLPVLGLPVGYCILYKLRSRFGHARASMCIPIQSAPC